MAGAKLYRRWQRFWLQLRAAKPSPLAALACGALLGLFGYLQYTHYLLPRADGLHSAGVTWSDLPIHLALASRFLHANGLARLEHPLFLGGPLSYPFLPDYLVAILSALGLSLRWAFIAAGLRPLLRPRLRLSRALARWVTRDLSAIFSKIQGQPL
jgi:hypothetical protein